MNLITQEHMTDGESIVIVYQLFLTSDDTYSWANTAGKRWPCSRLSGHDLMVRVNIHGLYVIAIDGQYDIDDIDRAELVACVTDHLPDKCRHLWPVWNK